MPLPEPINRVLRSLGPLTHKLRLARRRSEERRGLCIVMEPQFKCPSIRLGSVYGGWWVRPERVRKDSIVYSFGIGRDITYDLALIERFGVTVHAFDPTPICTNWINKQTLPPEFKFNAVGVAAYDGDAEFIMDHGPDEDWECYRMNAEADKIYERIKCPVRRLSTLMKERGHTHIDILKMDIEGAEYEAMDDLMASGIQVDQLQLEIHYEYGNKVEMDRARKLFRDLNAHGLYIHERSPMGAEFALSKKP